MGDVVAETARQEPRRDFFQGGSIRARVSTTASDVLTSVAVCTVILGYARTRHGTFSRYLMLKPKESESGDNYDNAVNNIWTLFRTSDACTIIFWKQDGLPIISLRSGLCNKTKYILWEHDTLACKVPNC